MTKAELESKHLSELHALAAQAQVPRYRMLARGELIERLSSAPQPEAPQPEARQPEAPQPEASQRPARRRGPDRAETTAGSEAPAQSAAAAPAPVPERPRRRRRRRFRRRSKQGVGLGDLLLPPERGRQALIYAESRGGCTALLRELAGELSAAPKGPDPVVLLIDPAPEELAEWKREAPQAEIVAAGQARHAADALAQAATRAGAGEDVILLIDSLSRLAAAYGDPDSAKEFFDSGRGLAGSGGGSLTVVAGLERGQPD